MYNYDLNMIPEDLFSICQVENVFIMLDTWINKYFMSTFDSFHLSEKAG